MTVRQILEEINYYCKENSVLEKEIKDVKIDHRLVEKGDLYIAIKGGRYNGNDYIQIARQKGAVCVVSEDEGDIIVDNARSAFALISKNYFSRACDKLKIIAITGTNGKTTTCNIIADILSNAGYKVGVIGTLGAKFDDKIVDTGFTTPDPYLLHKIFAQMKAKGAEYIVMEASAHALALNKLDGIKFEVSVLTNITEDHLDFFGDMETYTKAKLKLFDKKQTKVAICCKNVGEDILYKIKDVLTYGFDKSSVFKGEVFSSTLSGSHFSCEYNGTKIDVKSPLAGRFNIENCLASFAVCKVLGIDENQIVEGFKEVKIVEGRLNIIKEDGYEVIIDFAHTPDGLEKILSTANELSSKKVLALFGCGGNRDKLKRPIMGEIASRHAEKVILTSDNPRYENPFEIIKDIERGINDKDKYLVIENRKQAIEYALKYFKDYIVVIAGKGGEKYQEIEGVKYPFSDYEVVQAWIKKGKKEEI